MWNSSGWRSRSRRARQEQMTEVLRVLLSTAERLWADAQAIAAHRLMMVKDS